METLEISHVAPYLPFGVKIRDTELNISYDLLGIYEDKKNQYVFLIKRSDFAPNHKKYKLELRSLMDLDIFRLAQHLFDEHPEQFNGLKAAQIWCSQIITQDVLNLPYMIVQKLLEWHYDIYGLIRKGLAVDAKYDDPQDCLNAAMEFFNKK